MTNKEVKQVMNSFKTEVAGELGIDLKNPNLTAKEAGRVGGEMVKRVFESYKHTHTQNNMK